MRLELKDIIYVPGAVLPFSYELDLSELDFYGERPLAEPVKVEGVVRNRAELLELECEAVTNCHLHCASCGKPFERTLTVPIRFLLATELENEEDEDILLLQGSGLELDSVVTDEVIFAMDTKSLCREDCKGRCPRCGKDLNEGPCNCAPEVDPRWAALTALLGQDD
jgi:uncharacterized protein